MNLFYIYKINKKLYQKHNCTVFAFKSKITDFYCKNASVFFVATYFIVKINMTIIITIKTFPHKDLIQFIFVKYLVYGIEAS